MLPTMPSPCTSNIAFAFTLCVILVIISMVKGDSPNLVTTPGVTSLPVRFQSSYISEPVISAYKLPPSISNDVGFPESYVTYWDDAGDSIPYTGAIEGRSLPESREFSACVDQNANTFLASRSHNLIYKIDSLGRVIGFIGNPRKTVVTTVGSSVIPAEKASPGWTDTPLDKSSAAYIAMVQPGKVRIDMDAPTDIVCSPDGRTIYFVDGRTRIRRMTATDAAASMFDVATIAGDGRVGYLDDNLNGLRARFGRILRLALEPSLEGLLMTDFGNHVIRRIDLTKSTGAAEQRVDPKNNKTYTVRPFFPVTTIAGSPGQCGLRDGEPTFARLYNPLAISIDDATGIVYFSDHDNVLRRIEGGKRLQWSPSTTGGYFAVPTPSCKFPAALTDMASQLNGGVCLRSSSAYSTSSSCYGAIDTPPPRGPVANPWMPSTKDVVGAFIEIRLGKFDSAATTSTSTPTSTPTPTVSPTPTPTTAPTPTPTSFLKSKSSISSSTGPTRPFVYQIGLRQVNNPFRRISKAKFQCILYDQVSYPAYTSFNSFPGDIEYGARVVAQYDLTLTDGLNSPTDSLGVGEVTDSLARSAAALGGAVDSWDIIGSASPAVLYGIPPFACEGARIIISEIENFKSPTLDKGLIGFHHVQVMALNTAACGPDMGGAVTTLSSPRGMITGGKVDGPVINAMFNKIRDLAVAAQSQDLAAEVFISDFGNNRLRRYKPDSTQAIGSLTIPGIDPSEVSVMGRNTGTVSTVQGQPSVKTIVAQGSSISNIDPSHVIPAPAFWPGYTKTSLDYEAIFYGSALVVHHPGSVNNAVRKLTIVDGNLGMYLVLAHQQQVDRNCVMGSDNTTISCSQVASTPF